MLDSVSKKITARQNSHTYVYVLSCATATHAGICHGFRPQQTYQAYEVGFIAYFAKRLSERNVQKRSLKHESSLVAPASVSLRR